MNEEKKQHDNHDSHDDHNSHEGHESSVAKEVHTKKSDVIKINKRTATILAGIVLLGGLVYAGMYCLVAATVNGIPITRYAVMHGLERANGKVFLESLISEQLINNAARAMGVAVSDADIALELTKIEAGLAAQGANMDELLAAQGMTRDALKKQMVIRKKVELLLADKVTVTEAEVDKYITDSKIVVEAGKEQETRTAIMEQLKGQKLQKEAGSFVEGLRTSANVRYFGFYEKTKAAAVAPGVAQ